MIIRKRGQGKGKDRGGGTGKERKGGTGEAEAKAGELPQNSLGSPTLPLR